MLVQPMPRGQRVTTCDVCGLSAPAAPSLRAENRAYLLKLNLAHRGDESLCQIPAPFEAAGIERKCGWQVPREVVELVWVGIAHEGLEGAVVGVCARWGGDHEALTLGNKPGGRNRREFEESFG